MTFSLHQRLFLADSACMYVDCVGKQKSTKNLSSSIPILTDTDRQTYFTLVVGINENYQTIN